MKNLTDKITLLELKGRESSLGVSIFKVGLLLKYIKYKLYEKKITQVLRREFKNSIFVTDAKHYEKMFDEFKYINTIDDALSSKELLKDIYLQEDISDDIKIEILNALSYYIEDDDAIFYNTILKDIFTNSDISYILDTVWIVQSALYYIKKIKPIDNQKDIFWLKELEDKSIMIMQNHIEFFYTPKSLNTLRFISNALPQKVYQSSYTYIFPILRNIDDVVKADIKIYQNGNNNLVDILISIKDKIIFDFKALSIVKLFQVFVDIFYVYSDKYEMKKTYRYTINHNDINKQFKYIEFRYLKRDDDYYMVLNGEKGYQFDVSETFDMFKKIFLFVALYLNKKDNICIKELSCMSNRDFLMLIGVR